MLFNSFAYLLFLPIVFALHWGLARNASRQNIILLAASYFFYACWDARFLTLLLAITFASFYAALLIDKKPAMAKWILSANIAVNIGVLIAFKYFNFFAASFASLLNAVGIEADSVTLNLVLPVGISFFTFQAMGYSIDVYRRKLPPTSDFIKFATFISFFPQLVAGPIERATNLLPQLQRARVFDYPEAVRGMRLILWGLFKKMVVADNAAAIVNSIFATPGSVGSVNLWIGAILFSFQIYCDFSGYSDIAIGTAALFDIKLMRNFNKPYLSANIADFWRRWHISLTSWFTDYVYIPLGGNRKGRIRTHLNKITVFLISGLWHGANLTFLCWGGLHGCLILPFRKKDTGRRRHALLPYTLSMGITFIVVMIGWILFRADTLSGAFTYIKDMFAFSPSTDIMGKTALLWVAILMLLEIATRRYDTPFDVRPSGLWRFSAVRMATYALTFIVTVIFAGRQQEFIYFQF